MKQDIIFANVDLDIEPGSDLQPLTDCLGDDIDVLYQDRLDNGNYFVSLEFHLNEVEAGIYGEPNKRISAFCSKIENLSPELRKIWNDCSEKRFDIGFESGNTKKRYNTKINTETIGRVAEIEASFVITIYPVIENAVETKEGF